MSSPSIEQLQELPLPTAISYAPQTWGWLLVLTLLLMLTAAWLAYKVYRWRQNRYRREALARLDQLRQKLDNAALRELAPLLKRVALSMPQQPEVASLSGQAWQDFLQRSTPLTLPQDFARQLTTLTYAAESALQTLDESQRQALLSLCRQWVETHHVAA